MNLVDLSASCRFFLLRNNSCLSSNNTGRETALQSVSFHNLSFFSQVINHLFELNNVCLIHFKHKSLELFKEDLFLTIIINLYQKREKSVLFWIHMERNLQNVRGYVTETVMNEIHLTFLNYKTKMKYESYWKQMMKLFKLKMQKSCYCFILKSFKQIYLILVFKLVL